MITTLPRNASINERENIGPVLTIATTSSRAEIALYGATVLSFITNSSAPESHPVLWLSSKTTSANGNPIRGGIPLCAPWFGPHPTVKGIPGHGLVRINLWDLIQVEELAGDSIRATFAIDIPKNIDKGWNHDAKASFVVTLGKTLSLELTVRNTGKEPFLLSEAMHTYFAVSNVRNVSVEGLENSEFLEFAGDGKRHMHGDGPVVLNGEAANMFYSAKPVRLVDENWSRAINIRGYGAVATVVWNPWEKTALATGDIGEQWPEFICVENANIPDVAVMLPPNTSHHMGTEISVTGL